MTKDRTTKRDSVWLAGIECKGARAAKTQDAKQMWRVKNFDGTKLNKAEQLKWRGFLRDWLEIVEMAEGFGWKCGNGRGNAEDLSAKSATGTRKAWG
jgi:hypothetical protein